MDNYSRLWKYCYIEESEISDNINKIKTTHKFIC